MRDIRISLAAARVNAGLTQKQAAKALGIATTTLVSWEKGATEPKMSQSEKISEIYNIPSDYIFLPIKSN